jgi:putative transposase
VLGRAVVVSQTSDGSCVLSLPGKMDRPSMAKTDVGELVNSKGVNCLKSVSLFAMYVCVHSGALYRDLEEIMAEQGVTVDHATLNRWVEK